MTNTSVQEAIHTRVDPVLEAIIQGLIETASHPEMAQADDAVTKALTEALVVALMAPPPPRLPRPEEQISPLGTALASALATALAPALAKTLAPAIVEALSKMAKEEKPGQEKPRQEQPSGEGSGQQEQHQ